MALWASDGTPEGTLPFLDGGGPRAPRELTWVGRTLFFTASDDAGRHLWKSDGTPLGTTRVKVIGTGRETWAGRPSMPPTNAAGLVAAGDLLFFHVDDDVHGRELWKSDGTPEGTVLVQDLDSRSGCCGSMAVAGRRLFYVRSNELYSTDGTTAGTAWLATGIDIQNLTPVDSHLFFTRFEKLHRSDGTFEGTLALEPERNARIEDGGQALANVAGTLFFRLGGGHLWKMPGPLAPAVPVHLIRERLIRELVAVGDRLFFTVARDCCNKVQLWMTDGTEAGTRSVADLPSTLAYAAHTTVGRVLYFVDSLSGIGEYTLWRSDGIDTFRLATFDQPVAWAFREQGALFFVGSHDRRPSLWKTDGTREGTVRIKQLVEPLPPS